MQRKRMETLSKDISNNIIKYVCKLHILRNIGEKLKLIDTYYPWYGVAVVYKKYIRPALYVPLYRSNTDRGG